MGLFGSFKVAPGVRLSTSSRGLRAHVGPRLARVHVGGGRSGVSTGAGPFTLYSGLGSSPQRRSSGSSTSGLTPAQAEKARQVAKVAAAWDELTAVHQVNFPAATSPGIVDADPVPVFGVLLRDAERRHLKGVARFDRTAREQARSRARAEAEAEALRLLTDAMRDRTERQRASDESWAALAAGEPKAVATAVSNALRRRGLDVSVVSDVVGHVRVKLQVPGSEAIPTHEPAVTPKGLPTLKKLNKTQVAHHVRQFVAARVLLAAEESLAQSLAISVVEVEAQWGDDTMLRTQLRRARIESATWSREAWDVLEAIDPDLEANVGGRTQELRPLK